LEKIVFVLNFKHTSRQAFFHGFMKGLAAPAMLYHLEQAQLISEIESIRPETLSVMEALARDWARVGDDMRVVLDSYGKAAN
jgi:hypothetical protein